MTPRKFDALLFDLNGTMIDDMHFHLEVWHTLLNDDLKAGLSKEEVRNHMYGKNHELLERVFGQHRFTVDEANKISRLKEDRYQALYRPHKHLLPGLSEVLEECNRLGVKMAIGSH